MNRVCKHFNSEASAENVYCPVCGKRLEDKKETAVAKTVFSKAETFVSAFFDPISFYRKAADEQWLPSLIFPGVFYLFFFSGVIAEKTIIGCFSALWCVLWLFVSVILSVMLFAANAVIAIKSSEFAAGDADGAKIIKTLGAGYFLPAVLSVLGFISNVFFASGGFGLSYFAFVSVFVPFYLTTSELNRKNRFMTYFPTVVAGLVSIIISALIYGLKF